MCNPTSQPPRRDLYELETTLTADNGGFLVPEPQEPRLTVRVWTSGRRGLYNADYSSAGDKFLNLRKPWTVVTPSDFETFYTYAEAATYAFKGMTK